MILSPKKHGFTFQHYPQIARWQSNIAMDKYMHDLHDIIHMKWTNNHLFLLQVILRHNPTNHVYIYIGIPNAKLYRDSPTFGQLKYPKTRRLRRSPKHPDFGKNASLSEVPRFWLVNFPTSTGELSVFLRWIMSNPFQIPRVGGKQETHVSSRNHDPNLKFGLEQRWQKYDKNSADWSVTHDG